MDLFNNREISIAIWVVILAVWVSTHATVRKSFSRVVKVFCNKIILTTLALMGAYISLLIFGLYQLGFWDTGHLKNTVIWSLSVDAISLFRINEITDKTNLK